MLCTVQLKVTRDSPPPMTGGTLQGLGRDNPACPHTSLCAPQVLNQRFCTCPALPKQPPLAHALTQSMGLLCNLFIRLFSVLGCDNYSVNYSQHNKILIMHSYFRFLRDMIIQPQNQGHI